MNLELSTGERSVVRRLAEDPARSVKPSDSQRYHAVLEPGGERIGPRVQVRTIQKLVAKGFLVYAAGRYRLSHAGRKALEAAARVEYSGVKVSDDVNWPAVESLGRGTVL